MFLAHLYVLVVFWLCLRLFMIARRCKICRGWGILVLFFFWNVYLYSFGLEYKNAHVKVERYYMNIITKQITRGYKCALCSVRYAGFSQTSILALVISYNLYEHGRNTWHENQQNHTDYKPYTLFQICGSDFLFYRLFREQSNQTWCGVFIFKFV